MNFHLENSENDVIDLHEALSNFNSATDDINDYVTIELSSNGDGTTDSIINISTEGNGVIAESIVLENVDLSHQGTFADSNAMLSNMLTNQTLVVE